MFINFNISKINIENYYSITLLDYFKNIGCSNDKIYLKIIKKNYDHYIVNYEPLDFNFKLLKILEEYFILVEENKIYDFVKKEKIKNKRKKNNSNKLHNLFINFNISKINIENYYSITLLDY